MINFEIMERSLKIAWNNITEAASKQRFLENYPKSSYSTSHYGGREFLTKCDYDSGLLNLENLPKCYQIILSYWQSFKLLTFNEHTSVKDYIIWNNRNIVLDGKPIFMSSWYRKGICYIKDLLNYNHTFLSPTDLKERYDFEIPFTTY